MRRTQLYVPKRRKCSFCMFQISLRICSYTSNAIFMVKDMLSYWYWHHAKIFSGTVIHDIFSFQRCYMCQNGCVYHHTGSPLLIFGTYHQCQFIFTVTMNTTANNIFLENMWTVSPRTINDCICNIHWFLNGFYVGQ